MTSDPAAPAAPPLARLLARMRSDQARFRIVSGGSEAVSAITVDEWADELDAALGAEARRQEAMAQRLEAALGEAAAWTEGFEQSETFARIAHLLTDALAAWGEAGRRVPPAVLEQLRLEMTTYALQQRPIHGMLAQTNAAQAEHWARRLDEILAAPLVRSSAPRQPQHAEEKDDPSRLPSGATIRGDRIHAESADGDK